MRHSRNGILHALLMTVLIAGATRPVSADDDVLIADEPAKPCVDTSKQHQLELTAPAPVEKRSVWKPIFFASVAASVAALGYSVYGYSRMLDEAQAVRLDYRPGPGSNLTHEDCGRADLNALDPHFTNACTWRTRSTGAALVSGGLGILAVAASYMAFVHRGDEQRTSTKISVTPTITTDSAGASLQLGW